MRRRGIHIFIFFQKYLFFKNEKERDGRRVGKGGGRGKRRGEIFDNNIAIPQTDSEEPKSWYVLFLRFIYFFFYFSFNFFICRFLWRYDLQLLWKHRDCTIRDSTGCSNTQNRESRRGDRRGRGGDEWCEWWGECDWCE
jgi:hypothetical protein